MNAVKGEANIVNRRRGWGDPLDASLFANSVSRATFDAMQLGGRRRRSPDFRGWMRAKARLHGHDGALPWWDLVRPAAVRAARRSRGTRGSTSSATRSRRTAGRSAGSSTGPSTSGGSTPSPRRQARRGVLHAVRRRPLAGVPQLERQRRLGADDGPRARPRLPQHPARPAHAAAAAAADGAWPRRPASSARRSSSRRGCRASRASTAWRCSTSTCRAPTQVVVDIRRRFLFETEVFARRQRRTLGVGELNELMLDGAGRGVRRRARPVDRASVHVGGQAALLRQPLLQLAVHLRLAVRSRAVRPSTATTPSASAARYDDVLSRCGMDTAEELGAAFGFDVTDEAFWTASLDVLRGRIAEYAPARRRPRACCDGTSITRYDADRDELGELLDGEPRYRVDQVWQGLYEQLADAGGDDATCRRRCAPGSPPSCRRRCARSPGGSATAATR